MRTVRFLLAAMLTLSSPILARAQQGLEQIPPGVEALRENSSSKTEFTLDHSMLVLASRLDSNDSDLHRVIAGVSGISVHRYRFSDPWSYDQEALRAVRDQYHGAGWMQVVNKHDKEGLPGATDLWVRWQDDAISNIAILVARSEEVTFIQIAGSISPLDLTHLGGHFGIPKIEGGTRVPGQHR